MKKDKKQKVKYSKFIVFLVILLNTIFATATLYAFIKVGSEPVTLIGAWFSFTVSELWLLSGIKKKEIDKEVDSKENYEERV
jgi:hypothetical protein